MSVSARVWLYNLQRDTGALFSGVGSFYACSDAAAIRKWCLINDIRMRGGKYHCTEHSQWQPFGNGNIGIIIFYCHQSLTDYEDTPLVLKIEQL